MFDQVQRSIWLNDQLWPKLREKFPIGSIPGNALITVGYPSSGARGRSEKIRPAEVNSQWTGNANEQVFISIHPTYFTTPADVAKAILFQCGKVAYGARWGARRLGVEKDDNATLHATPETQGKIDAILADIGEPPSGFGVPFPVRTVQRSRLRRYMPDDAYCSDGETKHAVIRAACDNGTFKCSTCGSAYTIG